MAGRGTDIILGGNINFKIQKKLYDILIFARNYKASKNIGIFNSFMQAQLKKAGVAVAEVKDCIATTNQIVDARIEKINGEESTDELLPNDTHPYDHYIVRSVIKFLW